MRTTGGGWVPLPAAVRVDGADVPVVQVVLPGLPRPPLVQVAEVEAAAQGALHHVARAAEVLQKTFEKKIGALRQLHSTLQVLVYTLHCVLYNLT